MTSGILLVDKPHGITSHDVVARVRRALGTRKVGHAGTLDPMATGLLLVGVDSATRLLTYLVGLDKEYTATIRLGAASTTDDADGVVTPGSDASGLGAAAVDAAIAQLTGEIDQAPSSVSAIKVDGRRAYDLVRAGEHVELAARRITVSRFEVLATRHEGAFLDLDVVIGISSGGYIRAIARDLGAALRGPDGAPVGGHLTALRRTSIGPFSVADAAALDSDLSVALRTPASVAAGLYPSLTLDPDAVRDLANGKQVAVGVPDAPTVAALAPDGRLAGLVAVRSGVAKVLVNFPTSEVLP